MATIGLDHIFYATITQAVGGEETYGTPTSLAEAIKADLSVEYNEATLYADDVPSETVKEFKLGKLSLNVKEIGSSIAAALVGASVDTNGVLINGTEDIAKPVAVGFRAVKSNGEYVYYWLYHVLFGVPAASLQTKSESITFSTPTIEGIITRRNKPDTKGKHPWKAEVNENDTGVTAATITGWFTQVYEPKYTGVV